METKTISTKNLYDTGVVAIISVDNGNAIATYDGAEANVTVIGDIEDGEYIANIDSIKSKEGEECIYAEKMIPYADEVSLVKTEERVGSNCDSFGVYKNDVLSISIAFPSADEVKKLIRIHDYDNHADKLNSLEHVQFRPVKKVYSGDGEEEFEEAGIAEADMIGLYRKQRDGTWIWLADFDVEQVNLAAEAAIAIENKLKEAKNAK